MSSLDDVVKKKSSVRKLGPTFARRFHLVRPAVSQVLGTAVRRAAMPQESRPKLDVMLRESTTLGTVYLEAMPRYACGAGLLDISTYLPTSFGAYVHTWDPALENNSTLWLMHYFLASPVGPGPETWGFLFQLSAREVEQDRAVVEQSVATFLAEELGRQLSATSVRTNVVSTFRSTYTSADALGKLGLLEDSGSWLSVGTPQAPSSGVFGFALAHYWSEMWPDHNIVPLRDLSADGGFGSLFLLGAFELNSFLRDLQSGGFVELWQVAPPHQAHRRFESVESFLPHIYE